MYQRYLILAAAVLMQLCLGTAYSWSVFARELRKLPDIDPTKAQWPSNLFFIVFPAMVIFSGVWLRRLGPRGCAVVGGLLFGSGWIMASLGQHHFMWTVIGVGLFTGLGVGFAYLVPISVGMQWFPQSKGLVTGLAVAGFGGGSFLVSHIASDMMSAGTNPFAVFGISANIMLDSASPFTVFRILGVIYLLIIVTMGLLMRYPSTYEPKKITPVRVGAVIGHRDFLVLYLAMAVGLAAGLSVALNLTQLCPSIDLRSGTIAVSIFAIANASGRIGWGFAFDRLFATTAIRLNLLAQAVTMCAAPFLIPTTKGLYVWTALIGFNYGGILVLYASETANRWGSQHVGQIYGWLFSANVPASFVITLVAHSCERYSSYRPATFTLAAVLLVTAVLTQPLYRRRETNPAPAALASASTPAEPVESEVSA